MGDSTRLFTHTVSELAPGTSLHALTVTAADGAAFSYVELLAPGGRRSYACHCPATGVGFRGWAAHGALPRCEMFSTRAAALGVPGAPCQLPANIGTPLLGYSAADAQRLPVSLPAAQVETLLDLLDAPSAEAAADRTNKRAVSLAIALAPPFAAWAESATKPPPPPLPVLGGSGGQAAVGKAAVSGGGAAAAASPRPRATKLPRRAPQPPKGQGAKVVVPAVAPAPAPRPRRYGDTSPLRRGYTDFAFADSDEEEEEGEDADEAWPSRSSGRGGGGGGAAWGGVGYYDEAEGDVEPAAAEANDDDEGSFKVAVGGTWGAPAAAPSPSPPPPQPQHRQGRRGSATLPAHASSPLQCHHRSHGAIRGRPCAGPVFDDLASFLAHVATHREGPWFERDRDPSMEGRRARWVAIHACGLLAQNLARLTRHHSVCRLIKAYPRVSPWAWCRTGPLSPLSHSESGSEGGEGEEEAESSDDAVQLLEAADAAYPRSSGNSYRCRHQSHGSKKGAGPLLPSLEALLAHVATHRTEGWWMRDLTPAMAGDRRTWFAMHACGHMSQSVPSVARHAETCSLSAAHPSLDPWFFKKQ